MQAKDNIEHHYCYYLSPWQSLSVCSYSVSKNAMRIWIISFLNVLYIWQKSLFPFRIPCSFMSAWTMGCSYIHTHGDSLLHVCTQYVKWFCHFLLFEHVRDVSCHSWCPVTYFILWILWYILLYMVIDLY